jgi:hypothetical protein
MGQSPVQSVNTQTGAVVLDADDVDDASTTHKFVTESDITNLGNLSGTNTGDQDLSSYQVQPAEGAFVDGDKTKLDGISAFGASLVDDVDAATARATLGVDEAGADNSTDVSLDTALHDYLSLTGQTVSLGAIDLSTDVTGLLPNTSVSGLGTAATTASTDYATAAHTHAIDDLSDVTITSASNEDVVKYNGSAWVNGQVSVDVDTPLTTALRGTDNPHIGAYPNQSFKVTDNPDKSVMVIADADGNLDFLVKSDLANIYLNTPSARKAASFGFSIVEDSTEPDIEVAGTLGGSVENYSVISGDSDSKGPNGLPIRQGFNLPDIGAYPAPILISGGSIA